MSKMIPVEPPYSGSRRAGSALLPSDIGRFLEGIRDRLDRAPAAVTSVSVSLHLPHEHLTAPLMSKVEEITRLAGFAHRIHLVHDRCEIHLTRMPGRDEV